MYKEARESGTHLQAPTLRLLLKTQSLVCSEDPEAQCSLAREVCAHATAQFPAEQKTFTANLISVLGTCGYWEEALALSGEGGAGKSGPKGQWKTGQEGKKRAMCMLDSGIRALSANGQWAQVGARRITSGSFVSIRLPCYFWEVFVDRSGLVDAWQHVAAIPKTRRGTILHV